MSTFDEFSNSSFLSQFRSGGEKVVQRSERGFSLTSDESSSHSSLPLSLEKVNWASSGSIASEISSGSMENIGDSLNLTNFGEELSFFKPARLPENFEGLGGEFGNHSSFNKNVASNDRVGGLSRPRENNEMLDFQFQQSLTQQSYSQSPPSQNYGGNSFQSQGHLHDHQQSYGLGSHRGEMPNLEVPRYAQQDTRFAPAMGEYPIQQQMANRNAMPSQSFRNGGSAGRNFPSNNMYPQQQYGQTQQYGQQLPSQHMGQHQPYRPNVGHGGRGAMNYQQGGAGMYGTMNGNAYNMQGGANDMNGGGAVYVVQHKNCNRHYMLHPSAPRQVTIGDFVIVDGDRGEDLGVVTDLLDMNAFIEMKIQAVSRGAAPDEQDSTVGQILRVATLYERQQLPAKYHDEQTVVKYCTDIVSTMYMIPMAVVDAEFQFDRHKLTIFYDAGRGRIDFRELVRDLYSTYKTRIWMKQVDQDGTRPFYPKQFATMALATGVQFNTEKF